ncbi:hypothetical protein [Microvirga sp. 2TAF3]|uniref:hypothetical protein n=1 Tax=Microvirga sp. 2TAF3 TaxID=3233014 RepID=UPI003F9D4777
MADKILSESINEKITLIEQVVAAIAQNADEDQLRELREILISLAGVLDRDPGIEMAADDLYAAARVVVLDSPVGLRPLARKHRLLVASSERLVLRLRGVCEREAPNGALASSAAMDVVSAPWRSGFLEVWGTRVLCAPAL